MGRPAEAKAAIDLFATYAAEKKKTEAYAPYLEENLASFPELRRGYYEGILQLDRTRGFPFIGVANSFVQELNFGAAKKVLIEGLKTDDRRSEIVERIKAILIQEGKPVETVERYEQGEIGTEQLTLLLVDRHEPPKSEPQAAQPPEPETEEAELDLKGLIGKMEEELGIESGRDSVGPLVKEFRERSQAILSEDSKTRIDLAFAFFEMELYKDAREEVARIPADDRHYLQGQCLLGDILNEEGSVLAALDVYLKCLRDDGLEESQRHHCRYRAIELYLGLNDVERAKKQISLLEKSDPNYRRLPQIKKEIAEKERLRKAS